MTLIIAITFSLLLGLALGGFITRIRKTENRDRSFGSHRHYFVSDNPFNPKGHRRLYTPHGDDEAAASALKHPEDFR